MKTFPPLLSLLFCLLSQLCFAQVDADNSKIDEAVQQSGEWFIKGKDITSVSIGVYSRGEVYTHHFGELDEGQGNRPTDNTMYEIASVTKTMTGYLAARAVGEGKIKLDDEITDYLDGPYDNLSYDGTSITIHHLLTHTSGLPTFLPEAMNEVFDDKKDREVPINYQALEQGYDKATFFQDLGKVVLASRPGERYAYSNAGAELVGYILENVYQKSIEDLFKESIWEANGMDNTCIQLNAQQEAQLAKGYWLDNDTSSPHFESNLWSTGYGVKTTLADIMKYVALQLHGEDPIVQTSQEVLFDIAKGNSIAYFWNVRLDRYGKSFHHHGGTTGMQNWLFIFPKYDLGVSIITNHSDHATPGRLSKAVERILRDIVPD
ncbi:MAG: serine hydrolase domain-containing protein [Bacteroidota bacterium]